MHKLFFWFFLQSIRIQAMSNTHGCVIHWVWVIFVEILHGAPVDHLIDVTWSQLGSVNGVSLTPAQARACHPNGINKNAVAACTFVNNNRFNSLVGLPISWFSYFSERQVFIHSPASPSQMLLRHSLCFLAWGMFPVFHSSRSNKSTQRQCLGMKTACNAVEGSNRSMWGGSRVGKINTKFLHASIPRMNEFNAHFLSRLPEIVQDGSSYWAGPQRSWNMRKRTNSEILAKTTRFAGNESAGHVYHRAQPKTRVFWG